MARRNHHGGFTSTRRAVRRESLWLFLGGTSLIPAVGGSLLTSLNAAALGLRPFTIIRTYLECLVRSDQTAASEPQVVGIGMAVVSDEASAIGVSAVPTPTTDPGSDLWLLHKFMLTATMAGDADGNLRGAAFSIDSKAMRKVEDGQDIVTVVEVDAGVSAGAQVITIGRQLIKLH